MAGTLAGVGDEDSLVVRCCFPEHLGDIPGTVGIVNEQAVTGLMERPAHCCERLRSRMLQKRASGVVHGSSQKVVAGGVADIELYGRVKRGHVDQIRLEKVARFCWRVICQSLFAQVGDILYRLNAKNSAGYSANRPPLEDHTTDPDLGGFAVAVTGENGFFPVIQASLGKSKGIA